MQQLNYIEITYRHYFWDLLLDLFFSHLGESIYDPPYLFYLDHDTMHQHYQI